MRPSAALATGLLLCAGSVAAEPPTRGEQLAAACAGCHGPASTLPDPGRLPVDAFVARMEAYRASSPGGADHAMERFARALAPEDVTALANHFAALRAERR